MNQLFDFVWNQIVAIYGRMSGLVRWVIENPIRLTVVLLVFIVIPLVLMVGSMVFSGPDSALGRAWHEYFQARNEVIASTPGVPARENSVWLEDLVLIGPQGAFSGDALRNSSGPRLWALQLAADLELADGARLIYINRLTAHERLVHAIELYEMIEEMAGESSELLVERALLGKAHAAEIILACAVDADEFKKYKDTATRSLSRLLNSSASDAIKATATKRKAVLDSLTKEVIREDGSVQSSFYSWLSRYRPPEELLDPIPSSQLPPGLPDGLLPLDEELLPPSGDVFPVETPEPDSPAEGVTPPGETPASDPPEEDSSESDEEPKSD